VLIEWYQCPKCGRRERWRAEIAGAEVECICGSWVLCPDLRDLGDDGDLSDASGSEQSGVLVARLQAPRDADAVDDELIQTDEPTPEQAELRRIRRSGRAGAFGLTACGRTVVWFLLSLLGFALLIHAIYLQTPFYIASASVVAPISWFMLWRAKREWLAGRSTIDGLQSLAEGAERLRVRY